MCQLPVEMAVSQKEPQTVISHSAAEDAAYPVAAVAAAVAAAAVVVVVGVA